MPEVDEIEGCLKRSVRVFLETLALKKGCLG
jgi:hypothetical protein